MTSPGPLVSGQPALLQTGSKVEIHLVSQLHSCSEGRERGAREGDQDRPGAEVSASVVHRRTPGPPAPRLGLRGRLRTLCWGGLVQGSCRARSRKFVIGLTHRQLRPDGEKRSETISELPGGVSLLQLTRVLRPQDVLPAGVEAEEGQSGPQRTRARPRGAPVGAQTQKHLWVLKCFLPCCL